MIWRVAIALLALASLGNDGCNEGPGVPLPVDHPWHVAALDAAVAVEQHPDLPSLQNGECQRWIRELRVVHVQRVQDFVDWTGHYPCTFTGERGCVTGSWNIYQPRTRRTSRPTIFLSLGVPEDGHEVTARHEMQEALMLCSETSWIDEPIFNEITFEVSQ